MGEDIPKSLYFKTVKAQPIEKKPVPKLCPECGGEMTHKSVEGWYCNACGYSGHEEKVSP